MLATQNGQTFGGSGLSGTNYGRMADRARVLASHALRVLRVAVREHPAVHDRQLRFRLGTTYAFGEALVGFNRRTDEPIDLTLTPDLIDVVQGQAISSMPPAPQTDIQRKADLALRWMERAWLTGDPLIALLYLFFALEALLGDASEGQKAHLLAFRQMTLGHVVANEFTHPNKTWFLYDEVRSGAVHGEDVPDLDSDEVQQFSWSVRRSLNQFVSLAADHGLQKRGALLKLLDRSPDQAELISWLRANGGHIWSKYLDDISAVPRP